MPWHTLFHHEFLDKNLDNVLGAPGQLVHSATPPALGPAVGFGPTILPGRWFGIDFDSPVRDVIGIDVKLLVHAPANRGVIALCKTEGGIEIDFEWENPLRSEMVNGELVAFGSLRIRVGAQDLIVDQFPLPHRRSVQLRITWHTSGQCSISLDGKLFAYDPNLSTGQKFSTTELRIGNPALPLSLAPRFFLHKVGVNVIREEDAIAEVLWEIATDSPPGPEIERCQIEAQTYLVAIINRLRTFMSEFTQSETVSWNAATSGTPSPFSQTANTAHKRAEEALSAFMEFIRTMDPTQEALYLTHIEEFLRILHDFSPAAFAQMLMDLDAISKPRQQCLDASRTWSDQNSDKVAPIIRLADSTLQIAQQLIP